MPINARVRAATCAIASTSISMTAASAEGARVVALTGDASIVATSGSSRMMDHRRRAAAWADPVRDASFANVGDLLRQVPLPVPAVLATGCPASGAAGPRRRHAASASGRGDAIRACRALSPGRRVHRAAATAGRGDPLQCGCRGGATSQLPAVRHRVRRREAHVGAGLFRPPFCRGVSRNQRAGVAEEASPKSGRQSRPSSPPSRACCATATITVET